MVNGDVQRTRVSILFYFLLGTFGCLLISDAVHQWRPAAHARHAGHHQAAVPAGQLRAHVRGAAAGNNHYNSNVTVLTIQVLFDNCLIIIVLIEYCVNELR